MKSLVDYVLGSPRRVSFYRAVEILERATAEQGAERIGSDGPVGREAIRFKHDAALSFSTSDVSRVITRERHVGDTPEGVEAPLYEITTTFLGLTGTVSPLPGYMLEEVLLEDPDRSTQKQFLDIFHHRILSLFYRAHSKYSYVTDYHSKSKDAWSMRVLSLAGVDVWNDKRPFANVALGTLLRLAPLLATRSRTASGLVAVVSDTLEHILNGAAVGIEQFVGRWVTIDERQLVRLGVANTTLGEDMVIGRRVFDRGGKFRLILGPLRRRAFQRFLPGGDGLAQLREIVTFYVRDPLDFDVELILAPGETPALRLSSKRDESSRLGLDTWVSVNADKETRVIVPVPSITSSSAEVSASTGSSLPSSSP
ncbi:MAG: type VI secretion system baseplate subunit TssG [Myxococcales bacterium]|nr:type VI secretion system baseplate subunit TssG [Myxococcales bacterium]